MSEEIKNIITVGASAGGLRAVTRLCASFHPELDAAVFIVIHISRLSAAEVILGHIQKHSPLPCTIPVNGEEIKNKHIYFAPADHHLMLEKGRIVISKGAYENHWRPSIDVLFRTAAAAYDSCVTGIILTGLLDDGSSGMSAIKRSGGRCMIQDPREAEFADMPNNVLRNVEVDYQGPIEEIAYVLSDLYTTSDCNPADIPEDVKREAAITLRMGSDSADTEQLGELTHFTCPDCGGSLTRIENDQIRRYRCYTGHVFTENALNIQQIKALEESLWVAIRMMEERRNLLSEMSTGKGDPRDERSGQISIHISRLREMLQQLDDPEGATTFI